MADPTTSWVTTQIAALCDVPEYGSEAWLLLTPHDPRRAAAVLIAAEKWRAGRRGWPVAPAPDATVQRATSAEGAAP